MEKMSTGKKKMAEEVGKIMVDRIILENCSGSKSWQSGYRGSLRILFFNNAFTHNF